VYPGAAQSFQYSLLSQERFKLQTSNSAGTFAGPIRTKGQRAVNNLWQKESWAYPGAVEIFRYPPIILGTGEIMDF